MDRFRFHYTQLRNRVSNTKPNNIAKLLPDFVNIFRNAGKSLKTTFPFKQSSVFKHVQPEWCDQNCTNMKLRKTMHLENSKKVIQMQIVRLYNRKKPFQKSV